MPDAAISIVSYGQRDLLDRCLSQLKALPLPPSWPVVVVDNNSLDGSAEMVRQKHGWVDLVALPDNRGFGAGHNVAYARMAGDYFFVLNPDVIVNPGSLQILLQAFADHPRAAVVGPCLLNPDGSWQHSARQFYTLWTVLCRRFPLPGHRTINKEHLMTDRPLTEITPVDWILGAAMAVRRSAFPGPRLFDSRYRLYFEDVDLCYFAHKAGWEVLYCPASRMVHDHQRASAKRLFSPASRHHIMSWIRFSLKCTSYARRSGIGGPPHD